VRWEMNIGVMLLSEERRVKCCVVGNEYWGYVVIRRERGKCCVVGNEYLRIAAKMRSVRIRVKDSNW